MNDVRATNYIKTTCFVIGYFILAVIGYFIDLYGKNFFPNSTLGQVLHTLIIGLVLAVYYFGGTFLFSLLISSEVSAYVALGWVLLLNIIFVFNLTDIKSIILFLIQLSATITPVAIRLSALIDKKNIAKNNPGGQ